jgi:hypothetical protein
LCPPSETTFGKALEHQLTVSLWSLLLSVSRLSSVWALGSMPRRAQLMVDIQPTPIGKPKGAAAPPALSLITVGLKWVTGLGTEWLETKMGEKKGRGKTAWKTSFGEEVWVPLNSFWRGRGKCWSLR